jgi:hypothetical protein
MMTHRPACPVFGQTTPIKITLKIKATTRLIHVCGIPETISRREGFAYGQNPLMPVPNALFIGGSAHFWQKTRAR